MTRLEGSEGRAPHRIVFSSEQFSPSLRERGRRTLWREIYEELYGPLDVDYAEDRPFSARLEFMSLDDLGFTRCVSTVERFRRTRHCVAAAGSDAFHLAVNRGRASMLVRQAGREATVAAGELALLTDTLTGEFRAGAENPWVFVTIPRKPLLTLVAGAEDLVSVPLDCHRPTMRYLRRYLDMLLGLNGLEDDAPLNSHIGTTLLDLVALGLGAERDATEIAASRGLRAARLHTILAEIKAGYRDPDFSVQTVSARLGLSPRYVQSLLHEVGPNFTERVRELRLQKARSMLADPRFADRRIIEIAYFCGFNEVSYFNRAFRRRFDAAPSELRTGFS
jgi:AraC-like DNA-binding protein